MDHISKWLKRLMTTEDFTNARLNPDGGPGEFYEPYPWEREDTSRGQCGVYTASYARRCPHRKGQS